MDARSYMIVLILIQAAGCTSLDLQPRDAANPVWATEGATAMRGNAVADRIEPPLEIAWDFDARAGFGLVSPLVIGDVVLVATRKGEVHAIDIATGKRVGQADFGDSIEGTPIYEDGILVVPLAWGGVALHAHDLLLGNRKWRVRGAPVSTGLVVHGGSVIAGDVEGYLRAYDIETGSEMWSRQLDERSGIYSTPVVSGDRLVAANDRGHVAALDGSTGSLLWSADAEAPVQVSLAANDETVFVATTRGQLRALDLTTGSVVWVFDLPRSAVYLTASALGEQDIVFGASDGFVRSVNIDDGTLRWSTDVSAAVTAPPVLTDHLAYVGTMEGSLIALRRTDGSAAWEEELAGRMKSAFAVKESRLIVLSEPRLVSLFQPRPEPYATHKE
jgi:outer membrane protein assembly factor BamB